MSCACCLKARHIILADRIFAPGSFVQAGNGGHWDIGSDETRLYDELYAWAMKAVGQARLSMTGLRGQCLMLA